MSNKPQSEKSLEEINQELYEQGMTDGLAVIPPTEERVKEMLRGTDSDPDKMLGRLGNNENSVTVQQLASNAVMAGCVPPYMPVLEAGVKALADSHSNSIQSSVSTGSWAYHTGSSTAPSGSLWGFRAVRTRTVHTSEPTVLSLAPWGWPTGTRHASIRARRTWA